MLNEKNRKYIAWGLTLGAVVLFYLVFSFLINSFDKVELFFSSIIGILMPVIYGFILTFLLAPLYNRILLLLLTKGEKRSALRVTLARFTATFSCVVFIIAILTAIFSMMIPSLASGVMDVYKRIPDSVNSVETLIESVFRDNPGMQEAALRYYSQLYDMIMTWVSTSLIPNINQYLTGITSGVVKVLSILKNFFIGIIVMAYMLNMKTHLKMKTKRFLYAVLPTDKATGLVREVRYMANVFSSFILGKLVDSIIVGVICYISMTVLGIPYAMLISVIVGCTNIIPVFGPFVGAIPSILILLMVSPVNALKFGVLILILQQLDGNIIGPKILGSATGVSSFWVLFAILFFGGLWGVVGMIVGIPTFAVIYHYGSRALNNKLARKGYSTDLSDYQVDPYRTKPQKKDRRLPFVGRGKKNKDAKAGPTADAKAAAPADAGSEAPEDAEDTIENKDN